MDYSDIMYEMYQDQKRIDIEEAGIKKEFKSKLKGLVNITGLYNWMDEGHEWWLPLDIVDIENTQEIMYGYPNYQTGRIINDEQRALYLKHNIYEIRSIKHYYVYQTGCDDSYHGYLLLPLKNGKYLKVEYTA